MTAVRDRALAARQASRSLAAAPPAVRNAALAALAGALEQHTSDLLEANRADLETAGAALPNATLQRLRLDAGKIADMAAGVRAVAALADPLGRVRLRRRLADGLELTQLTCPLGVLAVIFEARPDAATQISSLALKSGNAVLLKGGSEALHTNRALARLTESALSGVAGLPPAAVQYLEGRGQVDELLALDGLVDLVIPRGSSDLVRSIQARTKIPVLGHAEGVCHVYLDAAADAAMARAIVLDAKTQYPAACNAAETLLIHSDAADRLLGPLAEALALAGVALRGCPRCLERVPAMAAAEAADWDAEYGDLVLAVRIVDGLDAAIAHIHAHGSGHTECIVTEDAAAAERFLREVDAAGVYHNASTRFADGHRYGFGAEVGISTGRIHARGPVGLEGLLTSKYLLRGHGDRVADFSGPNPRPWLHQDLPLEP